MLHNMFSRKQKQCVDFMAIKQEQYSKKQFRKVSKNAIKKEVYMRDISYLLALAGRNLKNLRPSRPPYKGGVLGSPKSIATANSRCAQPLNLIECGGNKRKCQQANQSFFLTSIKVNFEVNLRQFKGIFVRDKKCAMRIDSHNKIRNLK